ncbi:calpain-A-like, partial [Elysia marginata]
MPSYEDIKRQCLRSGDLYEDPEFPAEDESCFFSKKPPRPFVWKRPKDICSDPQWVVGGASRFDIVQGMLGDCWLLSAVASLTCNASLLNRVVDGRQTFDAKEYCGAFKFNFWRGGRWEEVVVDDRLPTYHDKLVFMHSAEKNEFWSALLEKAYAKLNGSYEALKGGQTCEAMTDFTGGVTETFDLKKAPGDLFKIMTKAFARGSLMGCSIAAAPNQIEAKLDNGLVKGHAYSVTGAKTFASNPQFRMTLTDPDEDDDEDMCTALVAVMQKNRRKQKQLGKKMLTIGFSIYEVNNTGTTEIEELDNKTSFEDVPHRHQSKEAKKAENDLSAKFNAFFLQLAGDDEAIDPFELQQLLTKAYKKELSGRDLSLETARALISRHDPDKSGKLSLEEFKEMWITIRKWKGSFDLADVDKSGSFSLYELRTALKNC